MFDKLYYHHASLYNFKIICFIGCRIPFVIQCCLIIFFLFIVSVCFFSGACWFIISHNLVINVSYVISVLSSLVKLVQSSCSTDLTVIFFSQNMQTLVSDRILQRVWLQILKFLIRCDKCKECFCSDRLRSRDKCESTIWGLWHNWSWNAHKRLHQYGVRNMALEWFSSYLTNRKIGSIQ